MPDPTRLPEGCKFHPRCPFAEERCRTVNPKAAEISPGHFVKCLRCQREGVTASASGDAKEADHG